MRINERLRVLRKTHLKLSQKELASKLDITAQYLCRIENGKLPISKKLINKLYDIYNINEEWLESGIGDIFYYHKYGKVYKPVSDTFDLFQAVLKLDYERQKDFIKFIEEKNN